MSSLFNDEIKREVRKRFSKFQEKVVVYFFEPKTKCLYCKEEKEILLSLSDLSSDRLRVEIIKGIDSEIAKKMKISIAPALVIQGKGAYNIRYFGLPAGYEFGALVEDIVDASRGFSEIDDIAEEFIKRVDKEVKVQVFVTPTCPYCPLAVRTVHKFAIINTNIYADMVEALEFPDLANKYRVYAVPKNVIKGLKEIIFEGAIPEVYFAAAILKSINKEPKDTNLESILSKGGAKTTKIH